MKKLIDVMGNALVIFLAITCASGLIAVNVAWWRYIFGG